MLRSAYFLAVFSSLLSLHAATVQYAARKDVATGAKQISGFATGDFNGDGKVDFAVADSYGFAVTVFLGDGTGNFGKGIATVLNLPKSSGLGMLLVGDVNEDGILDLIDAPIGGDQSDVVLLGKGDGTFQQSAILSVSHALDGVLIDLNGDKHLDIVGAYNTGLNVALGDGKGNFTPVTLNQGSLANGTYFIASVVAGDFNRDNHLDLLSGVSGANTIRFFAGMGNGSFGNPVDTATPEFLPASSLATADFDGDGKLDLLVGAPVIASIAFGNGDGTFQVGNNQLNTVALPPPAGGYASSTTAPIVATADVDGDGTPDVIASDINTNLVSVFLNSDGKGTFLQSKPDFSGAVNARSFYLRLADVNGDGLPDILVGSQTTGAVQVFLSIPPPKATPVISFGGTPAVAIAGQSAKISVKLTGTGPVPTGSVTLMDGSSSAGQQTLDATGSATFNLANLSAGQHSLTANYSGDKSYTALNSSAFTLAGTDFAVVPTTLSQTVQAGGTASYGVTITPNGAFTGSVTFTCSGLPAAYACSSSTTPVSGSPTTAVVTVSAGRAFNEGLSISTTAGGLGLCLLCAGFVRRKRLPTLLVVVLGYSAVVVLQGCSGGSSTSGSSSPGTGTTTPVTPTTTTFTVTATGTQGTQTVAHNFQATLTVQ